MRLTLNGKPVGITPKQDESLLDILTRLGYRVNAPCGGGGRCGKCRVTIANAAEPTETDKRMIKPEDLDRGVRLACATAPFDGLETRFEQTGERAAHIATEGESVRYPFAPQVLLARVKAQPPDLASQTADLERLASALGREALEAPRDVLGSLPGTLRSSQWDVTVVLKGNRLLGLNHSGAYGLAVDIGTTTIASYLLDMQTGQELAVTSSLNPQKAWGDDVISRSDVARAGSLDALQKAVALEIGRLTDVMCAKAGVRRDSIYHATFTGNTVMMHLFAGVTPENIAMSPFIPAFTSALECSAEELGLNLNRHAAATLLPCVAGYIGADTVAGMLAVGMREESDSMLLIDIGTNGEIALSAGGKLYACSTAAGPAFEGAHISNGMGGVAGAINKVTMDGSIRFTTIGNEPARGICGSGLLDLVAGLLDAGAVDDTGRIDEDAAPSWIGIDNGRIVVDKASGVSLTGRDIREVQLAKGAIAAGIDVLLAEAGVGMQDVRHVYLAGGFGSYLDKRSAGRIGLIPAALVGRTSAVGNSSGAGAKAALLSAEAMKEACRLAKAVRYVELSARKDFQDAFMDKMLF